LTKEFLLMDVQEIFAELRTAGVRLQERIDSLEGQLIRFGKKLPLDEVSARALEQRLAQVEGALHALQSRLDPPPPKLMPTTADVAVGVEYLQTEKVTS
jgi:hypothetical protein